ncbi:hypothetical protein GHT06_017607 [Daphnia sinensis]|uniref:Uncharacterized protein n=1 Tax=Daphnia sinensis TaxID=1820382 RepID=A0AAD5PQ61_9CRUS|nr:hypothetical protein GHT06_017607 [Daphnia sinensis]
MMDTLRYVCLQLFLTIKVCFHNTKQFLVEACRTVKPLNDPVNRQGEYAVITGGNRGIGFYTIHGLLTSGMKVIAGCRDGRSKQQLFDKLAEAGFPTDSVEWINLDLSSLDSVRNFAKTVLDKNVPISLLVNNAAIVFAPYALTKDGFEQLFAVNYLAHFLLTHLLLPRLIEAGEKNQKPSRIVNVSSDASFLGYLKLDDLQAKSFYNSCCAYSQSKLAQVLFTEMLDTQLIQNNHPVNIYALHPGVIRSNWYNNSWHLRIYILLVGFFFKTESEGAQRVLYTSLSPELENSSGVYLSDCKIIKSPSTLVCPTTSVKLWDATCQMLNINQFGKC